MIAMMVSIYLVIKIGNIEAGVAAIQGAVTNLAPQVVG
jgi:hypothetical protein